MSLRLLVRRIALLFLMLFCLSGVLGETIAGPSSSATSQDGVQSAVRTGAHKERSRHWLDAIKFYEQSLKTWPDNRELKYGLRRSKIHFGIDRRYADRSFDRTLLRESRQESLELLDEILVKVRGYYVESLSSTSFIAHGTESFYLALANEKFTRRNLRDVDSDRVRRLRRILREQYWNKPLSGRTDARRVVNEICDKARDIVGLPGSVVVMEYVFGGCNALDDYSYCLSPDRFSDLNGIIKGEFVGLGIEMKAEPGKGMLLVNVLPDSPAEQGGMHSREHIVRIDGTDCRDMTTDEAAKLLRGPAGTTVRISLQSPGSDRLRVRLFTRRAVQVKSIPTATMIDEADGIGYIRMTGFQQSTPREFDAALTRLRQQGMRSLIWDVRGNPGGLLAAAVEILDRLIDSGVLVSTRGRVADQNWVYSAHRRGSMSMPLVLLVDGDSASASEIVAGAVRDHQRGTIVGRKTFGKWSVQSIFTLERSPGLTSTGLKLTTARFYSPAGHNFSHHGLMPDAIVAVPKGFRAAYRPKRDDLETDPDVKKGIEILHRQLTRR